MLEAAIAFPTPCFQHLRDGAVGLDLMRDEQLIRVAEHVKHNRPFTVPGEVRCGLALQARIEREGLNERAARVDPEHSDLTGVTCAGIFKYTLCERPYLHKG